MKNEAILPLEWSPEETRKVAQASGLYVDLQTFFMEGKLGQRQVGEVYPVDVDYADLFRQHVDDMLLRIPDQFFPLRNERQEVLGVCIYNPNYYISEGFPAVNVLFQEPEFEGKLRRLRPSPISHVTFNWVQI